MKKIRKTIAALVIAALVWTPTAALAETFDDYTRQGQDLGKGSIPNPADLFGQDEDGNFVLFPDSGKDLTITQEELFPGSTAQDLDDYSGLYGQDSGIAEQSDTTQKALESEVSWTGEAYRTVFDSRNQDHPDLRDDPLWGTTDATLAEVFSEEFSECELVTEILEKTKTVHVSDMQTCQKIIKPNGDSCTIEHAVDIYDKDLDIVFLIDTTGSMEEQIEALCNGVKVFAEILTSRGGSLRVGGAAYGDKAYRNDPWRIPLTEDVEAFKAWGETLTTPHDDEKVFDAIVWAKDFYGWREDVTRAVIIIGNNEAYGDRDGAVQAIKNKNLQVYAFHNKSSVYTLGTHVADAFSSSELFKVSKYLVTVEDHWFPESCIEKATCIKDGFCDGDIVPNVTDEDDPVHIGSYWVSKDDPIYNQLSPPPFDAAISRLTTKIAISNLESHFNEGEMGCWVDPYGNEHCVFNEGDIADTCGELRDNPQCGYIRSECIEGAKGPSGTCYAFTEIFDCGEDVEVETATIESSGYVCEGEIRCMGESCIEQDRMQSTDFATAVAALQAAQFAGQDLTCVDGGQCEVFKGQAYECKIAVGGTVNCCDQPTGTSLQDYMDLLMVANKVASAEKWLGMANPVYGSWTAIKDGVSAAGEWAWSKMTQPFTKAWESLTGKAASGLLKETPVAIIQGTLQSLTKQAAQWVLDTFGEAAVNALFSGSIEVAGETVATSGAEALAQDGLVELGGSVLGPVMWAYMAYQIAMILIQIIWECEQSEFELGSKRQLKSCHYVGSYCATEVVGACIEEREAYCCFQSPLSRIINEQIKEQLGLSWGDPEDPECGGILISDMERVDWSQINLDEWIGILSMTGHMPTTDSISLEGLTGAGSTLELEGKVDTVERVTSKMEGSDLSDVNEDLRQGLYGN